jgi:hypothetical protein
MDTERRLDTLVGAVADGPVDCDGLRVERDDGYAVETP